MKRSARSFTSPWEPPNNDERDRGYLFRPKDCQETLDLIANQHLYTDDEIIQFLHGSDLPCHGEMADREHDYSKANHPLQDSMESKLWRKAFHKRRREIRELTEKLDSGGATIDEDGRLVPVTQPPQPPRAILPPPPIPEGNNNINNFDPLLAEIGVNVNLNPIQEEQEVQAFYERERQRAASTIAQEVQRLRREGVPEDDFEVILMDPRENGRGPTPGPGGAVGNGFARRLFFTVIGIMTAFACIILHALPLLSVPEPVDLTFDSLLYELLDVRNWTTHQRHCQDLANRNATSSSPTSTGLLDGWRWWWNPSKSTEIDCSAGVLHVPLSEAFQKENASVRRRNMHLSWFFPCVVDRKERNDTHCVAGTVEDKSARVLPVGIDFPKRCFRGMHDDAVSKDDVYEAIRMGHHLIEKGGDHLDMHYDINFLRLQLSRMIRKLENLLRRDYLQETVGLRPVAFRVLTTAPMDGHGVRAQYSSTLNHSNYWKWVERSKEHNQRARYPWPFGILPKREKCNLVADRNIDPRFCILTSVFLADGAGKDYRGASILFMDHHSSNDNPKRRIQRGVTIDGQIGRVVVSTGGVENLRCRFPTRSGCHVELQIWWECGS
ncbi:hypothetical protein IV203_026691 [Nitzschia inconspicua]|uniref:Uncharacterized protein n=1 Tax=Nitzschia inconspicua TaxID=303405 RepID=A0A9K3LMR6_9STRA|nr:hypothetical protein IV203_026691 [Nitzschia inconspicua]